jgi:hypothetical protein
VRRSAAAMALGSALVVVCLAGTAVVAPWLCGWLLLAGMFVTAWLVSWRTSHDVFAPLLPVTGYLFLGIGVRGLALLEGWVPNKYGVPLSDSWLAASVFVLGALATGCCILGYRSRTGRRLGTKLLSRRWANVPYTPQVVTGFSVVAAIAGLASLLVLRHRFGGIAGFGDTPAVVVSQVSEGGMFSTHMLIYFPLAGFLIAWRRPGMGLVCRLAVFANFALIITWFVVTGSKSLLFEFFFGLLVLHHYLRRHIRGRTLLVAVIPALVLVSLAFYFKDYGLKADTIASQYSDRPIAEAVVDPLLSRSYQFDSATMILAKTKSLSDYRMGGTLEELLWFYIPRQWWPNKPLSFGFTFGPEYFPGSSATAAYTPSILGELYLDFGIPGVMVGFYLLGIALRASYEGLALRKTWLSTVLYIIVLFRFTNMVEGPIATHVEFLAADLLPVALLVALNRFALSHRSAAPLAPIRSDVEARRVATGPVPQSGGE